MGCGVLRTKNRVSSVGLKRASVMLHGEEYFQPPQMSCFCLSKPFWLLLLCVFFPLCIGGIVLPDVWHTIPCAALNANRWVLSFARATTDRNSANARGGSQVGGRHGGMNDAPLTNKVRVAPSPPPPLLPCTWDSLV